ncbi:MAG: hypothetical protein ACYDAY_07610 [Candidatus Dormibacteria bacterium]
MPYRVETRFQLSRVRDLPPFLWEVLKEVHHFRHSRGAESMWLKGRLWELQAGSYSHWVDRESMLDYVRSRGHSQAAKKTQADWARETWISLDGSPPVHFQRCSCGETTRGARPKTNCHKCGLPLPSRLGPAPERPLRGVPITFRIPAARWVRGELLNRAHYACPVCGHDNPDGYAYCEKCQSRTRLARSLVTRSARWEFYAFFVALLFVFATSLYVVSLH